ncbi:MAG: hypothetical protein HYY06_22985 [Deltaproteobacteria bacterium]|nr:hypothetical protein [Deltaproteobacteria bacterium]
MPAEGVLLLVSLIGAALAVCGLVAWMIWSAARGPKVVEVRTGDGRTFRKWRLRVLGRLYGPIVWYRAKGLFSLRTFEDHFALGLWLRRSYSFGDIQRIEPLPQPFGGPAIKLWLADGSTWAMSFYDAAQKDEFLGLAAARTGRTV